MKFPVSKLLSPHLMNVLFLPDCMAPASKSEFGEKQIRSERWRTFPEYTQAQNIKIQKSLADTGAPAR